MSSSPPFGEQRVPENLDQDDQARASLPIKIDRTLARPWALPGNRWNGHHRPRVSLFRRTFLASSGHATAVKFPPSIISLDNIAFLCFQSGNSQRSLRRHSFPLSTSQVHGPHLTLSKYPSLLPRCSPDQHHALPQRVIAPDSDDGFCRVEICKEARKSDSCTNSLSNMSLAENPVRQYTAGL